tara:strand:+ start:840 stop:1307 length:468 start_codon:yes stop_codon:yes gene_type:complete
MSYSNCQYLYLSNSEAIKTAGSVLWQNIPTLSQSSRECYITVSKINVVFAASQNHSDIIVKGSIPTINYKSTDNSEPLIAVLHSDDGKVFDLNIENPIHLLSNDNIKSFKLSLSTSNTSLLTVAADSCNVLMKIEYIDQLEQTELYISQKPRTLD